jgi:hypothetical protein
VLVGKHELDGLEPVARGGNDGISHDGGERTVMRLGAPCLE